MKKTILLLAGLAFFMTMTNAQTVTDYDGNVYNTVTIGTQVWLKENLKVTHYRNGVPIPNVTVDTLWKNLTTGAYCDYNNSPDTSKIYGRLYNLYAVKDSQNIAPIGWHIPSYTEWTTLINYLGGRIIAGGKLKEQGITHWEDSNYGATNESGFTALPGGSCTVRYFGLRMNGFWWSTTGQAMVLNNFKRSIDLGPNFSSYGYSIRCLRDSLTQINDIYNQEKIDIYPNPTTDKFYIVSDNSQNQKMQVYNSVGQCVLQRELNNQTNEIDISSLTRGIYILKLTSSNGTIEKKIIKE